MFAQRRGDDRYPPYGGGDDRFVGSYESTRVLGYGGGFARGAQSVRGPRGGAVAGGVGRDRDLVAAEHVAAMHGRVLFSHEPSWAR